MNTEAIVEACHIRVNSRKLLHYKRKLQNDVARKEQTIQELHQEISNLRSLPQFTGTLKYPSKIKFDMPSLTQQDVCVMMEELAITTAKEQFSTRLNAARFIMVGKYKRAENCIKPLLESIGLKGSLADCIRDRLRLLEQKQRIDELKKRIAVSRNRFEHLLNEHPEGLTSIPLDDFTEKKKKLDRKTKKLKSEIEQLSQSAEVDLETLETEHSNIHQEYKDMKQEIAKLEQRLKTLSERTIPEIPEEYNDVTVPLLLQFKERDVNPKEIIKMSRAESAQRDKIAAMEEIIDEEETKKEEIESKITELTRQLDSPIEITK